MFDNLSLSISQCMVWRHSLPIRNAAKLAFSKPITYWRLPKGHSLRPVMSSNQPLESTHYAFIFEQNGYYMDGYANLNSPWISKKLLLKHANDRLLAMANPLLTWRDMRKLSCSDNFLYNPNANLEMLLEGGQLYKGPLQFTSYYNSWAYTPTLTHDQMTDHQEHFTDGQRIPSIGFAHQIESLRHKFCIKVAIAATLDKATLDQLWAAYQAHAPLSMVKNTV